MSAPFDKNKRPKVGIGVIVTSKMHPGCVLLGVRKGSAPGSGLYALPGGHLEFGESWEECGARETLEETGLTLTNVQYCTAVNAILDQDYHYITLFVKGEVDTTCLAEPENLEPDKCEGWAWYDWEKLPPLAELFCPLKVLRSTTDYNPFQSSNIGTKSSVQGQDHTFVSDPYHQKTLKDFMKLRSDVHLTKAMYRTHALTVIVKFQGSTRREEWTDCAYRETLEETGLHLRNIRYQSVINALDSVHDYHYVELVLQGEVDCDIKPEPDNMEPDKCDGWLWVDWNHLPPTQDMFCGLRMLCEENFNPFL